MYNPLLQKIEVLKLEKRLDDQLLYLRDAPYEYSTFSFDLAPVPLPKASSVPVNTLKVWVKVTTKFIFFSVLCGQIFKSNFLSGQNVFIKEGLENWAVVVNYRKF